MKYLSYWILPIISAVFWLATLLGLLLYWTVTTNADPGWVWLDKGQYVAFISDVGASKMKPWFIVGCIFTTVFLNLSFVADRYLRHKGRLVPESSTGQKVLNGVSLFWAVVGMVGLCCLSGFDTHHYHILHDIFLLCFMGGYLLSAVFICWEYQRLGKHYRQHRGLRYSFWIKLTFILVELGLAIAFAVTQFTGMDNVAGILEWVIAFIFTFYVLSFCIDLYPVSYTRDGSRFELKPMSTLEIPADYYTTNPHGVGQHRDSDQTAVAPGGDARDPEANKATETPQQF